MTGKDLAVLTEEPFNAETDLEEQSGLVTPNRRFYVRCHFPIPSGWPGLVVGGAVGRQLHLGMAELRALPSRSLLATLECAGNGRRLLEPAAAGEQWGLGAVSTACWRGVSLRELLGAAGILPSAVEVLFAGADAGRPEGMRRTIAYERSLPSGRALEEEVLLAYEMNGEPLPEVHGGPLRLVVPGWYGMASVKWLVRIEALESPFRGYFQATRYVRAAEPLREIAPRAVITRARPPLVGGYCWSGAAPVARVELSVDGGRSWVRARLDGAPTTRAWTAWDAGWSPGPGTHTLLARATDEAGESQPDRPSWNPHGYGNNAVVPVRVAIRSAARSRMRSWSSSHSSG